MYIILVEWLVRFSMAPIIIVRKRSPPVALAWLAVVAFLPVIGAAIYFLVGENRLVRKRFRKHENFVRDLRLRTDNKSLSYSEVMQPELSDTYKRIANLAESAGAMHPMGGNQLQLFSEAASFVDGLVSSIAAADGHCHLVYYIFNDDEFGRRVAHALTEATARKVPVQRDR